MALELATRTADRYGDGARFVPLAAIDAAVRVVPAIAQALGVVDDLAEYLPSRELLLVVDNLEQVLEAAPDLAALLATAPRVTLLATSRAPLRIAGERELAVSPLAREPAVELFVTRARALGARVEPGPRASSGSATGSTGSRSRSSSPPRARSCSARRRSSSGSSGGSTC